MWACSRRPKSCASRVAKFRVSRGAGPIRLGIDLNCLLNRRGYGRFTRGLLDALLADPAVRAGEYEIVPLLDRATLARVDLPVGLVPIVATTAAPATRAATSAGRRSLGDLWTMRRAATRARLDLLLYPSAYTYFPPPVGVPTLVTVHDVIPERFPRLIFPNRRGRLWWRLKLQAATRRAALVLTPSHDAACGIAALLPVDPRQIRVVGAAPDEHFRAPRAEGLLAPAGAVEAPSLLYVGGLSPHKNLGALIASVGRLRCDPALAGLRLVIVGDTDDDSFFSAHRSLRALVAAHNLEEAVAFIGYLPDDELRPRYHQATALVLPSFAEGFGLPAVEALACGTPVVASTAGSLPEVIGDAGVYFDPHDAAGLDWALRRVLTDPALRAELARRGPLRAARFNWARTARATLQACDEVVRADKRGATCASA